MKPKFENDRTGEDDTTSTYEGMSTFEALGFPVCIIGKKGELFYRVAKNMLSMVENLERDLRIIDSKDEEILKIGSSHIPTSQILYEKIAEFKKKLTPRELEIFDYRVFSDTPATLQEIGDRYGISRERVRQVEKNIIKKMREFFKKEIPDFDVYTYETER